MQYPHTNIFPPPPPVSGPPLSRPPRHDLIRRFFITVGVLATITGGILLALLIIFPDVVLPVIASAFYVLGSRLLFGETTWPEGS